MSDQRASVTDLRSRGRFTPDFQALARNQIAATRQRLNLSPAEFARQLGVLLSWKPTPEAVESWEQTATPPGDVLLAADMLMQRAPSCNHGGLSDPVESLLRDRFDDLRAAYPTRAEFLNRHPVFDLLRGAQLVRCAGLSLNLLTQQVPGPYLATLLETGAELHCLFLDPGGESIRHREAEEGQSPGHLAALTVVNIRAITHQLVGQLSPAARMRVQVRTYDEPLRYNLLMIDDHVAVVQPYLYRARGLDTPTFYIERNGEDDRGIYSAFADVYDWLWQRGQAHANS